MGRKAPPLAPATGRKRKVRAYRHSSPASAGGRGPRRWSRAAGRRCRPTWPASSPGGCSPGTWWTTTPSAPSALAHARPAPRQPEPEEAGLPPAALGRALRRRRRAAGGGPRGHLLPHAHGQAPARPPPRAPEPPGRRLHRRPPRPAAQPHHRRPRAPPLHPRRRRPPPARPRLPPVGQAPHVMLTMTAFVCDAAACRSHHRASSPNHIAVVAHFRGMRVALFSQPGHPPQWHAIRHGLDLHSILPFQGRLYATVGVSQRVVRVYPPDTSFMSYAPPADDDAAAATGIPRHSYDFLVESGGRMLLAMRHATGKDHPIYWQNFAYTIFEVDLHRRRLIPLRSLGDRALFLHDDRCLSVSATDLPSICGNSVYFSLPRNPTVLHSLAGGESEDLTASCQIHDTKERIRASVRPFTIADHLLTYCHHDEWARGLMFHEYHRVPESSSFVELHKKMKRRDSRLRIPRTDAALGAKAKL